MAFAAVTERVDEVGAAVEDAAARRIGLESPGRAGLEGLDLNSNWKARQQEHYAAAIAKIQSFGITVNGCFILGLDADTPEIFDDVLTFVRESGLYDVQVTFQTAFPGTPLYARLLSEGRILQPGAWDLCTLFDINFQPKSMTVDQLQSGFLRLVKELYSAEETRRRRRGFKQRLRRSPNFRRPAAHEERLLAA